MLGHGAKTNEFFGMFDAAARNVHEAAEALLDLMVRYEDVPNKAQRIKNLEHAGDEHTHRILEKLAKMFITPLDREDIQQVAMRLDDVLDEMETAANRLVIFRVAAAPPGGKELAQVLVQASGLLVEAFAQLPRLDRPETILSLCVAVHTQENEGDRLVHGAVADLFEKDRDPREIIQLKDIYESLERGIDRCEDVADVLQTVVVKHG
jgi:predicted phosphate transport protein (TIGR00153 family)